MMDTERKLIIDELHTRSSKLLMNVNTDGVVLKDPIESQKVRTQGNELFMKKKHDDHIHEDTWRLYSKSIALAPLDSEELALAYSNRSALLMHFRKYRESIQDIERALQITNSKSLKAKLYSRKAECLTALGSSENRKAWEEAKSILSQIKEDDKDRDAAVKVLDRVEKELSNLKVAVVKEVILQPNPVKKLKPWQKESANAFNFVDVKYNVKYGRHVVAKRDFAPGEIIFKEEPYIKTINPHNTFVYCGHCLRLSWSSIPCDHCSWIMFCSEDCKKEAWQEYHEVECNVVSHLSESDPQKNRVAQYCIRALLKGIREAGSIENLQKELNHLDMCKDESAKGFSKDGKFENDKFHSLYHTTKFVSPMPRECDLKAAAKTLIFLARYSSMFGKNYKFNHGLNFTSNKTVVFVGSLFLKFVKVIPLSLCPVADSDHLRQEKCTCKTDKHSGRGEAFSILTNLVHHSCDANVRTIYSEDVKMIFYALKPIKKDEMLFKTHTYAFFQNGYEERRIFLKDILNDYCDCRACVEKWPQKINHLYSVAGQPMEYVLRYSLTSFMINCQFRELFDILKQRVNKDIRRSLCNKKSITELGESITSVWKDLNYPNHIIYVLICALVQICDRFYGCVLQMPTCKRF